MSAGSVIAVEAKFSCRWATDDVPGISRMLGGWQPFSGPFLYYSGRRLPPPLLRAFLDYVRTV